MSKIPIVARSRGCQLATTVPVLLFTWAIALCYELFSLKVWFFMVKLTPPGKPSTWFPGDGLVTQAQLCHLVSMMSFKFCCQLCRCYQFVSCVIVVILLFSCVICGRLCHFELIVCLRNLTCVVLKHF